MKTILCIFSMILLLSCGKKEDDFSCDKNTQFNYNNERRECAHARVVRHNKINNNYEQIYIAASNSSTNFELRVEDNTELVVGKDYTYENKTATVIVPGLQSRSMVKIRFTKLDREAKLLSGTFSFSAQFQYDYSNTTYNYNADGSFSDVSW